MQLKKEVGINMRKVFWFSRIAVSAGFAFTLSPAFAECGQLGEWNGALHDVPTASCHPHCEGSNGDSYDFTDTFPQNAILDAQQSRVICSGHTGDDGCSFLQGIVVSVDNLSHAVYTHVKSRSVAVQVKPLVCILEIK